MYVDSTDNARPAGMQPVAKELRKYVEPLLKVKRVASSHYLYGEVKRIELDVLLPSNVMCTDG